MVKDGYKVYVERVGWSGMVKVWLGLRSSDGKHKNATVDKDGQVEFNTYAEGEMPSPLFILPQYAWEEIIRAINEQLPNVPEEVTDAELKATKYHLEDMRKLVFKDHGKE